MPADHSFDISRGPIVHTFFIISIFMIVSCTSGSGRSFVPRIDGYREAQKQVFVLKKKLVEISGIFCQNDGRIAAMNDEDGKLFIIDLERDSIDTYKFAGKADYEDIVKTDSFYYILESNGDMHEIRIDSSVSETQYKFTSAKKIEFESLVLYPDHKLVMFTKDHRSRHEGILAYSFDPQSKQFSPEPIFVISMKDILYQIQNYLAEFKPAAAAINPKTHKLFLIASIGKVLIQCSIDGKVEKAFKLNPAQFPQPEGISFAANGDMYISNEGIQGKATILKFPYAGTNK